MSIYLDNTATTKPCQEAITAINECLYSNYGNPSSLHTMGLNAQLTIDSVRKIIASSLACEPASIYFTSGATESNNLAVLGAVEAYGKRKPKIVTTTVEHSSVRQAMKYLEEKGFEIVRISPNRNGEFEPNDFIEAVDENTCLVSMMLINNETGYILPVRRAFYSIKKRFPEVITHCDCVQGFMKLPIKVTELQADLVSLSGHKIHTAKGIGALYIKKGIRLVAQSYGGKQEKGIRSGTESVPLIAGLGAAVKTLTPTIKERCAKVQGLKELLLERLSALAEIRINSTEDALPYIVSISVDGIRSEIMLHFLEKHQIYVSSGSACSKGAKSGVLGEFGIADRYADSALRISLCADNTEEEIIQLVEAIKEGQQTLVRSI